MGTGVIVTSDRRREFKSQLAITEESNVNESVVSGKLPIIFY
jgi:hypothetical protein